MNPTPEQVRAQCAWALYVAIRLTQLVLHDARCSVHARHRLPRGPR